MTLEGEVIQRFNEPNGRNVDAMCVFGRRLFTPTKLCQRHSKVDKILVLDGV